MVTIDQSENHGEAMDRNSCRPRSRRYYVVHRMTYRGEGGWSQPLSIGPLRKLVRKYLKHVGTEEFFELM